MFNANLHFFKDSENLETLVLGNRIIVNEYLFKDVFGSEFSSDILYMNGIWPEDFEVSLNAAKTATAERLNLMSTYLILVLFLCYKNRI